MAHNHIHYEVDNLRDAVDDLLYSQYHLRDEQRHLQEGQHHLQEGQRHLQDEQRRLHVAIRELQERLLVAEQGNPHQRQDDIHNAVRVVKDTLAEITGSRDEQAIRANETCQERSARITVLERNLASRNLSGAGPSAQMPSESSGGAQGRVTNVGNNTAGHEVLVVENNAPVNVPPPPRPTLGIRRGLGIC